MRIGFFGGSFDPIHIGHLILAEQCREQARLDEVWFVPSATSPHKRHGPTAGDRQRLEMVQIAIAGHSAFQVSEIELRRGGVSYTVDSLRELTAARPQDDWFFLLGGDALGEFARWREPAEICRLAIPLVYARPGSPPDLDLLQPFVDEHRFAELRRNVISAIQIDVRSTELRELVRTGRSIRYLTPRSVEKYIETHRIYGESQNPGD